MPGTPAEAGVPKRRIKMEYVDAPKWLNDDAKAAQDVVDRIWKIVDMLESLGVPRVKAVEAVLMLIQGKL